LTTTQCNAARIAVITFVLAILAVAATHNAVVAADDWLPISPADLSLKDNPGQPGADAMILYRNSHVDARRAAIDGDYDEEYFRIKVFTERGAEAETTQRIVFYKEESDVKDVRARTVEPDGTVVKFDGKVIESVVEGSGESHLTEKRFTFANVQPGAIVEFKYRHEFMRKLLPSEHWTVSGRLFTRDAVFSIAPYVPSSSFASTLYFRTTGLAPGSLPQRQGDGSYEMQIHNIPAVVVEPLMPPVRSLEARVEFFYREAGTPPNETTEQYWNRIGRKWSDAVDKFTDKKHVLEQVLSQTVSASDTPEQKLQKLYTRVQKIPDLSYQPAKSAAERKAEDIKPNENVEDVIQRNSATGRQINWLFIGLARAAGFQADAVYFAPRNRDVFIPSGQSTESLTADLVWVSAGGKEYWLDPAAIYYPFGLLPWTDSEAKGVRVSKSGGEFVQLPASVSADATVRRTAAIVLNDDGSATGTLQVIFTGVPAAAWRTSLRRADETGRTKLFERDFHNTLPAGSTVAITKISDWDDTSKPVQVEGTFKIATYASEAGHRLLVPASLFVSPFHASFTAEKRVNDVRFNERFEDIDDVTIRAPAGFTVEALPETKALKAGPSFYYEISASELSAEIEIKRHFTINDLSFSRDQYSTLRGYFLKIKSNDEAQVVLSTTTTADSKASPAGAIATPDKN
jgi:Domain of Unknown Function with PDB structure (DUF3857)